MEADIELTNEQTRREPWKVLVAAMAAAGALFGAVFGAVFGLLGYMLGLAAHH